MQKCIDEIMDNFDFRKVAKVMNLMEWRLQVGKYDNDKPFHLQSAIPDESYLRTLARELMKRCVNEGHAATATGPFLVEAGKDYLKLYFVVCEWDAYENEVD